ncbi:hypothetical protein ACTWLI_12505 [Arthrobacter sp. Hor0625]|uniref:hypothetical protein n=1 Tax=Arthrobacter sp. Hor0625 TaxID=3457358 RepID=UPI00403E77FF
MSEVTETEEEYDFSTDPHGLTKDDVAGQDLLLEVMLAMAHGRRDDGEGSLGLTVTIDGVAISGIAISAKEWRRRMSELLEPAGAAFASAFTEVASDLADKKAEMLAAREAENRPAPAPRFIHMRDAYLVSGNTHQKMPLWRGRLSKLSGWSIGSINTPEESKEN